MPFSTDLALGTCRVTRGAGPFCPFPLVSVWRSCGGTFWPGGRTAQTGCPWASAPGVGEGLCFLFWVLPLGAGSGGPVELGRPGGPKSLCADSPCWRYLFHPPGVIPHSRQVELNRSWPSLGGASLYPGPYPALGRTHFQAPNPPPLPPPSFAVFPLLPLVSVVFLDPCAPWGFDCPPALEGPLVSGGPLEPTLFFLPPHLFAGFFPVLPVLTSPQGCVLGLCPR